MESHFAQVNAAVLRYAPDDPRMTGFSLGARVIRRAAETAQGHLWSEQSVVFGTDFVTRSVWHSLEALEAFVYSGVHARYMGRRAQWFIPSGEANVALWRIGAGERPELDEALLRLAALRENGPSEETFGLGRSGLALASESGERG